MTGMVVAPIPRSLVIIFGVVIVLAVMLITTLSAAYVVSSVTNVSAGLSQEMKIIMRQHNDMMAHQKELWDDITYFMSLTEKEKAAWRLPPSERLLRRQKDAARLERERRSSYD